jgi:hypothetical protein
MKNSDQSKSLGGLEKRKKSAQEFLDARFLHDRFCKFEIPYVQGEAILALRRILEITRIEVIKNAKLSFKLNSLRWFLTLKGKEFLKQQESRYEIDKKIETFDFDAPPERLPQNHPEITPQNKELNQIVTELKKEHTVETKKRELSIIDFLA